MSSLITISAKSVGLQGYQLTDSADMLAALTYMSGLGYTGVINCQIINGSVKWSMNFYNTAQNSSQVAQVGDWIVLENGSIASVCPAANFATLYATS